LENLIILLKLDYYDRTMIREFEYFIKLNYYNVTIVGKFSYVIKVRELSCDYCSQI
jgi:hypothetical protein